MPIRIVRKRNNEIALGNFCRFGSTKERKIIKFTTTSIDRFDRKYWRVDGGQTGSFAVTNYLNGFEVVFRSRMTDDLVGVLWDSKNTKDHAYLSYETNYDYNGVIWDFDFEVSDTMPVLNDEKLAVTLTVRYMLNGEEEVAYVALFNYADIPDGRKAHIRIDWSNVKAGFNKDVEFPVDNITQIFFSGITSSYVGNKVLNNDGYPTGEEHKGVPLEQAEDGYIRLTNSVVTGANSKLQLKQVVVPKHNIGISTSFDDHYDLNPQRLVDNLETLGYNGFINHYCGMSHYPEMKWDTQLMKWQIPDTLVTGEYVVNHCTKRWHEEFAKALNNAGMVPVFSVSYEMYSLAGNEYWAQRDWNDNLGRTGYEPPSYFFSLCNENAIAYLHKAFIEFAETMVYGGCEVNMQIGEPWWWYNPSTTMPCVYDNSTRVAFNNDTGLYAPNLGTIYEAMNKTDSTSETFKTWLRTKLGESCQGIRTMLKQVYPDCKVCPLIFFPTIRTHVESLVTYINYPVEHYQYPNFDYIMTEAYDWLLEARLDLSHSAVGEIPILELKYPPEKVAYLAGFVPDSAIAYIYGFDDTTEYRKPIWQRIVGDMSNNNDVGVMKQLIWAYPQVMFDSITFDKSISEDGFFFGSNWTKPIYDNTPYPEDIFLTD